MQLNAAISVMQSVKLENKPDWWLDEHKWLMLDLESKLWHGRNKALHNHSNRPSNKVNRDSDGLIQGQGS